MSAKTYRLELLGFCRGDSRDGLTIEEARAEWQKARRERFEVKDDRFGLNHGRTTGWNMWELWQDSELVASGSFTS
jgi:hypothetical protein